MWFTIISQYSLSKLVLGRYRYLVSDNTNGIGTLTSIPIILACDTSVLQCAWPST